MESEYVRSASRKAARKAAKAAAADIEIMLLERAADRSGSIPLYTWGSMAAACAMSFFVIKLAPGLSGGNTVPMANVEPAVETVEIQPTRYPDIFEIAEVAPPIKNNKPSPAEVDDISVGAINPQEAEPIDTNLGVVLGKAAGADELKQRMTSLRRRAPDLFSKLEGTIVTQGEAQISTLVAGPFKDDKHRAEFCRSVMLDMTISCAVTEFNQ